MCHSNDSNCWIDGDLSRENVSQNDVKKIEGDDVTNISDIISEIVDVDEEENADNKEHQRHLCSAQVNSPLMMSQLSFKRIDISDSNAKFPNKSDSSDLTMSKTPSKSNFEKIRLSFEAKIKGNTSTVTSTPRDSPSLVRLMQLNEKRLSESLKTKQVRSHKKKLKKCEKEAKLAKESIERNKFRDIQIMFDRMSKNFAKNEHSHDIKPKKP